jgi:hypothetical protein
MVWINLAQDKGRWLAFVNKVINFGFYKMRWISWLTDEVLASQEGLCSI